MTQTLIKRRDKVVAAYINQVCPVVDPTLGADGALRFANAAVDAGAATAPSQYTLQWFAFDNAADARRDVGSADRDADHRRTGAARAPERRGLRRGPDLGHTPEQPRWSIASHVHVPARGERVGTGRRRALSRRVAAARRAWPTS